MKLQYFSENEYQELFDEVSINVSQYLKSNDGSWLNQKFNGRKYYRESRIDVTLPCLTNGSSSEIELSNIMAVYNTLKDKLNPKQAANPYLWSYLSHFKYWEYTINRWFDDKEPSEAKIRQRFFCGSSGGSRIGLLRNSISRLWWFGYLTYQPNSPRPYELTELMCSHSDLVQAILERKFSMNRNITIGILSAIKEINDDPKLKNVGLLKNSNGESQIYEWRELCKYINRFGAVTLLDTLSPDEIKEISKNYILSLRQ